jgi:hypothetical protein
MEEDNMHESRDLFQNTKRRHYATYAAHSLDTRLAVAARMVVPVYGYFCEKQPEGYVSQYGTTARSPKLPTFKERRWLERLADYVLAEDHKRGLSLRARAGIKPEDDEDYPPIGSCARQYMDYTYYLSCIFGELTPDEKRRLKTCEVCGCEFIDRSQAINAKRCRYPCDKRKDAVRQRVKRYDSDQLKRYRERQDLEYPFYSPVELREISERGESVRDDIRASITRVKLRQERGKRTPTNITMDSDKYYSPNMHKKWRETDGEVYPVITYNLNDKPEKQGESEYLGHVA